VKAASNRSGQGYLEPLTADRRVLTLPPKAQILAVDEIRDRRYEMHDQQVRGKYALALKLEAVRLVKTGDSVGMTAEVLGIPKASLSNWLRSSEQGQLGGAGDRPVAPEGSVAMAVEGRGAPCRPEIYAASRL
jgi:hypothetical protein